MNVKKTFNKLKTVGFKNGPAILTALGCAGMVGTVVLAVRATPKAIRLIENENWEQFHSDQRRKTKNILLTKRDIIRVAWKCYIPTVCAGIFSLTCFICSQSENARRNAALAAAFTLSDASYREYKSKVESLVAPETVKAIRDDIAKDRVEAADSSSENIVGTGTVLYLDLYSGRYFKSDAVQIDKAINLLNKEMLKESDVTLNDLYYLFGLEYIKVGGSLGWSIDNGFIDVITGAAITPDGLPCLALDYTLTPKTIY